MVTVGIDEVGRGCWAGPLVAAAVVLGTPIHGLTDSKVLSRKRRGALDTIIKTEALAIGIGWVSPEAVDSMGITMAVKRAMEMAISEVKIPFDQIIIDGNYNYLEEDARSIAVIRADMTEPSVSAASIIAKVARDAYMREAASVYPGYGFEKHVGYGTQQHVVALDALGICELHRRSFKPIMAFL